MIDLAEFRELLDEPDLSDDELLALRDHLYDVARLIVESYEEREGLAPTGTLGATR